MAPRCIEGLFSRASRKKRSPHPLWRKTGHKNNTIQPDPPLPDLSLTKVTQNTPNDPLSRDERPKNYTEHGDTKSMHSITQRDEDLADLWRVAFERLEKAEQEKLSGVEESMTNNEAANEKMPGIHGILETVIERTKYLYECHEEENKQNGKAKRSTAFRETFRKIIDAALSVKPMIDSIVACDKSGYATLAWSIVSVGLTVIKNRDGSREALLQSPETIADILALAAFAESKYRSEDSLQKRALRSPIIDSYTAILRYSSEIVSLQNHGVKNFIKTSLLSPSEQPLQKLKEALEVQKGKLKDLKLDHYLSQSEKANTILDFISEKVEKLMNFVIEQRDDNIFKWLAVERYDSDQQGYYNLKSKDTLRWLIDSEELEHWKQGVSRLLHCEGEAGAGKTVATAAVIRHLQENYQFHSKQSPSDVGIAFVYCKIGRTPEPTTFMSVLLKQLCRGRNGLPSRLIEFYEEYKRSGRLLSYDDAYSTLEGVVQEYERVFVAIDALNEYKKDYRDRILGSLVSMSEKEDYNLHIFTTSQVDVGVKKILKNPLHFKFAATSEDVDTYLHHRLKEPDFDMIRESPALKELVMDTIRDSASGSFLLATLQLNQLKESVCGTPRDVKEKLQHLPGRNESYTRALEIIRASENRESALKLLRIVAFARRDLKVEEARHAFAVNLEDAFLDTDYLPAITFMERICAGLVIIDLNADKIELIHPTAKDYLTNELRAGSLLARICITYLSFAEFQGNDCKTEEELISRKETYAFYEYSAINWDSHLGDAEANSEIGCLAIKLLCSPAVASFSQLLETTRSHGETVETAMNGFHVTAMLGHPSLLSALLREDAKRFDECDSMGRTPLLLAVEKSCLPATEILLRAGANTEAQDTWGDTPLHLAVKRGEYELTKILVNGAAIVDLRDHEGRTPLSWAAYYGHARIAKLLIDHGAIIDSQDNSGRSALSIALSQPRSTDYELEKFHFSEFHFSDQDGLSELTLYLFQCYGQISRLLLMNGADLNLVDVYGRTPVSWAALNRLEPHSEGSCRITTVSHHKASLHATDCYGWTPLIWNEQAEPETTDSEYTDHSSDTPDQYGRTKISMAAKKGLTMFIKSAIKKGIDIDAADSHGATLLSWAAEYGHLRMVMELLQANSNLDLADGFLRTPLSWAAANGHPEIVHALFDEGASPDIGDCNGQTPLSLASQSGNSSTVRALMQIDTIDLDRPDDWDRTPLSWAAKVGNREAVYFLLNSGVVDINSMDRWGWTPLSRAAENGCSVIVRDLLSRGANPNIADYKGRSPLLRASQRGSIPAMDSILASSHHINVDAYDLHGRTSLSYAAESGYERAVQRLLHYGANSQVVDSNGRTSFCWAAQRGHVEVIRILIDNNPCIDSRDNKGRTALSWAAEYGHEAIVNMFMEKNEQLINLADFNGWTPLMWAARYGHSLIVRALLEKGAIRDCKSIGGRTAFSLADKHHHGNVLDIFALY